MLAARRGAGRPCALRLDEQTGDGPANRPQQNACQIGLTDLLELPVTPLQEIAGTGGVLHKKPHSGVRSGCRIGRWHQVTWTVPRW
jgi:hypothetical protein